MSLITVLLLQECLQATPMKKKSGISGYNNFLITNYSNVQYKAQYTMIILFQRCTKLTIGWSAII